MSPPQKPGRRMLVALIVSISLNLFILGLTFGDRVYRDFRAPPDGPGVVGFVQGLPPEARRSVRQGFAHHSHEMRRLNDGVHQAQREIAVLLEKDDLTREELDQAFTLLRERSLEVQAVLHGVLAQAALETRPQDRARWSERWQRRR